MERSIFRLRLTAPIWRKRREKCTAIDMNANNVNLVSHPLVQHKLSLMREKDRSTKGFRELLNEIGMLLCYEITRDLPLEMIDIETPLAPMRAPAIAGRRRFSRRHAGARSVSARRAYRSISRSPDLAGGRILLQGAARFVGSHRGDDGSDAGDGKFGMRGRFAAQGARRPRHTVRLPACRAGRHRALPARASRRSDLDGRGRREAQRSRLYPARPRRRRRQA